MRSRSRSKSPKSTGNDAEVTDADTEVAASPGLSSQRQLVVQKFRAALEFVSSKSNSPMKTSESLLLARRIEAQLHEKLDGRRYTSQARSLLFNLKDGSNVDFRESLLSGELDLTRLPEISAEEMASSSRNAQRAHLRQQALAETSLRPSGIVSTDKFRCGRCLGTKTKHVQNFAVESCVRSGGEPVETTVAFVTCLTCHHTWTERSGFA